jgi:8-amino-7-oxononanoate synthase
MSFTPDDLEQLITEDLAAREGSHQLRVRKPLSPISSTHIRCDGVDYVNFASNNYLGLTHHPRLIAAARRSLEREGLGSGAASLITGYTTTHAAAEASIARWKGTQDAVLLPSGYQANHAVIQTLAALRDKSGGVRFLLDKLVHASIVDAVRASGQPMRVFPHNHLPKLRRLLKEAPAQQMQVVVTESIFSMDGDAADLAGLVELKRARPFILVLDEAHGSGVYGPSGAGLAAELGVEHEVDVSVVTLSKALGSVGGVVCGSKSFCAALVNHGRAFIYSTAMPSWVAAAATEAIEVLRDEPQRAARVRELARSVRQQVTALGFEIPPGDAPIVPVIVGEAGRAMDLARRMRTSGLWVPAVRPPTVAAGASRLRLTVCCDHTDLEIERLLRVLAEVRRDL